MIKLEHLSLVERTEAIKAAAEHAAIVMKQSFPESEGYRHRLETSSISKEKAYAMMYKVIVQRGWLWGYSFILKPTNTQLTTLKSDLGRTSTLMDRALTFVLCLSAVAMLLALIGGLIEGVYSGFNTRGREIMALGVVVGLGTFLVVGLPILLFIRMLMAMNSTSEDRLRKIELNNALTSAIQPQGV